MVALLCTPGLASAAEVKVLASGGFRAAYMSLVPEFQRQTGHTVQTTAVARWDEAAIRDD